MIPVAAAAAAVADYGVRVVHAAHKSFRTIVVRTERSAAAVGVKKYNVMIYIYLYYTRVI